jgi:8-oxo-dGTP diphosphatase
MLMHHRDDRASVSPNQWSLPGGHVEPGKPLEQATHRQ